MSSWLLFGSGAALTALAAVPVLLALLRRLNRMAQERHRLHVRLDRRERILEGMPDGFYLWDHLAGGEMCSSRLAVLLELPEGTKSGFRDVTARFAGEQREFLRHAVKELRDRGRPFETLLTTADGGRSLHVQGRRAADEGGQPAADIVWMRDGAAPLSIAEAILDDAEELVRRGGLMATIFDNLPIPLWIRNSTHDVLLANAAMPDGYSGRSLAARAADKERAQTETLTVSSRQGQQRLTFTEMPLPNGGLVGFGVPAVEVDSSALEIRFGRRSADSAILEGLPVAVAVFGADTRLVFTNLVYRQLWHLDQDWLAQKPTYAELLAHLRDTRRLPEYADFSAYREESLRIFESEAGSRVTLLHLPDNTTFREVATRLDNGGVVLGYEDVTERLELESSYQTVLAVQRETIDNLHEGVAVFGSDGRLKLSNPAYAQLWALGEGDLAGEPHLADLVDRTRTFFGGDGGTVDDERWSDQRDGLVAQLLSREPFRGRLERNDGKVIDYSSVPLPDGGALVSYLDVTDEVLVERALRERAEAVTSADRLKSDFIANLSYEVRAPLNTIIDYSEALLDQYFGTLSPRQSEYGKGIHESAETLLVLLNDVIDLASVEAGTLALDLGRVDMHSLLLQVMGLLRERARHGHLQLDFDCPPEIGVIEADEKRLKQILFHLLNNAIKYTPEGGTVRLSAHREGDDICLEVADTGVGIPSDDQDRVFDSFEKGQALKGTPPGAGLGLTLVKRFIELHGGTVLLNSRPGEGTTITCRLPGV